MDINIYQALIVLIGGIMLLWWSGDKTVTYSHEAAHLFGFSSFFIGFVFMAVATGLPELAITITAAIKDVGGLSAGTIIGSNFSDIALVLGIPAFFIGSIEVVKSEYKNLTMMLLITALVMASVFVIGTLNKFHGVLLIALYAVCLWILWKSRYAKGVIKETAKVSKTKAAEAIFRSKLFVIAKLLFSVGLLLLASELSVRSAVNLAGHFNLALESIGATIFAVGTSLPELTVSVNAVKRKDYSLALGNALGSVLEQGTLILGILALTSRSPVHLQYLRVIAPFMFAAFGVLGFGMISRRRVNRLEGGILLALYVAFIINYYFIRA